MSKIENIFEKLYNYYQVGNISELSKKINASPSTISNWKQRNSINAIKKKCRELNIYKEIFESEDLNSTQHIRKAEVNRALYSAFKRRSLSYLYYLLKKHNIKNSTEFFNFHAQKDEEDKFKSFISDFFSDLTANVVSFHLYREEFMEFTELYLNVDEIDFIFENKEVFISSIYKIMEHKLKSGV